MWGSFRLGLVLATWFYMGAVSAFQLGEHERITRQAVAEFRACFPKITNSLDENRLIAADLDEDTNLFNKELFFSHFFHPYKKLSLWWREDSAGRIENLKPELLQCRQKSASPSFREMEAIGHALHHYQDMAAPAHVVPVNHSLWDGFESYPLTGDIGSGWNCQQIAAAAAAELEAVLRDTAVETLMNVRNVQVEATIVGTKQTVQLRASDFWQEANDDGFGDYGTIGNHFGEVNFSYQGETYQVSEDFYREFKRHQLQLAVRATLRGLAWTLGQKG